MAERVRNAWIDWLIYLAVRTAVSLLQALPYGLALAGAEALAAVAYRVDRRHRRVADENVRSAFPELGEIERDRLVRRCYRHFALVVLEIAVLPRKLRATNWRTHATLENGGAILTSLLQRRPVLIVTLHFGNWELAGFALGAFGFRTHAIARVLDNPYLERFLKDFRQRTGQTIIAKKDDFDRLNETMRRGGKIATLGDQDAGSRGVFVDFFGRPASAHKAVALMALEYDAKLIVIGVPRVREGSSWHYTIGCEDEIDPRDFAGDPNPVKAITQRYHAAYERLIRRHPEQYFWLHRRWKTAPPVRKPRAR